MIFIRRSDEHGRVNLRGRPYPVDQNWPHRLVRCDVDFTHQRIRFYALRRRDPEVQPLLQELIYSHPSTRRKAKK